MWDGDEEPPRPDDAAWSDEPSQPELLGKGAPRAAVQKGARIAAVLFACLIVLSAALGATRLIFGEYPSEPAQHANPPVPVASIVGESTPLVLPTGATATPAEPHSPSPMTVVVPIGLPATVVSVIDGDTIHVEVDGHQDIVRIIGIDTPETRQPGAAIQCFGPEATVAAEALLPIGSDIGLELDPTQAERDRYDRLLAHVWLADGSLFAERMIRAGLGTHYVYGRVPSIHATVLGAAEDEAHAMDRGLWAACP